MFISFHIGVQHCKSNVSSPHATYHDPNFNNYLRYQKHLYLSKLSKHGPSRYIILLLQGQTEGQKLTHP